MVLGTKCIKLFFKCQRKTPKWLSLSLLFAFPWCRVSEKPGCAFVSPGESMRNTVYGSLPPEVLLSRCEVRTGEVC